ncbi:MAG: ABC transporter ATP-binding protein [Actinomycetia bacterium]|nr:ABC transporter ATP-binding protein [Actinomycetes bacterium]
MQSKGVPALAIEDLSASFFTYRGEVVALADVELELKQGEMLGIVGATGSGKSVLARAVMNQVRAPGRITKGSIRLQGEELLEFSDDQWRETRGRRIALISSNPRHALDPLTAVGVQLGRAIRAHDKQPDPKIRAQVIEALESVRIPDAKRRHDAYPHELSVGMAQRVLIAMALLHEPEVIIADEPTAGLDVTVQRQVLDLMKSLLDELGSSKMVVTRDLGIVAHYCDRIAVMKDGRVLEETDVRSFFSGPSDFESQHLLARTLTSGFSAGAGQIVVRDPGQSPSDTEPLLSVRGLVKHFPIRGSRLTVKAVNGVSFDVAPGEALGLVGESGSGKTTVGRLILRLIDPTEGRISFEGADITTASQREFAKVRSRIQMVFQEPHASLNPNMTVGRNIEEPLRLVREGRLSKADRTDRVRELLQLVQLGEHAESFPHNLSAGQAQRVGVARAIATNPRLVVLDEPTSLLDISVRGEILELLNRIKDEIGMSYIFISHDLTAVRSVCSRIAVMYLGRIIELGDIEELFERQRHPYSRALLASVLYADPDARVPDFALSGEIPSPVDLPSGCFLESRCPLVREQCTTAHPPLEQKSTGLEAACYFSDELMALKKEEPPR